MEKVFLSVLNMSMTASFVIAAIMLARLLLKKAPKIISYALWAVAGFRLVFPFNLESVFSLLPFKSAPIPQDIAMQAVPRIDSGITIIDNAISASLPAASPYASVNPLQIWIFIGSCVWLFGAAVMLIYSFVSIALLKHKLRAAALLGGNLYEADNLKTPFVIGLFRPKIYIPSGLSGEERRYIVLHEQTHIKRHDHAVKIIAYLVLCLHWFNPLAWASFILMGADMEMSCDERVIRELGGDIKNAYSMSLVRVAAGRRIINGSPLAFSEGGMKERIKNVLNFKKPSRVIIILAVALAAALSVGFAVNRSGDFFPMTMNTVLNEPHFAGTVTQVYDDSMLVSVNEDEDARRSSGLISVSLDVKLKDSTTRFLIGDKVIVYYDGMIAESYPAQVRTVYTIVLTSPDININIDGLNSLFAMRTPYVGDNSAVGKIVNALPRIDRDHKQRFLSIGDDYGTGRAPYTLTIYYEPNDAESDDTRNTSITPKNSALLFALINNLEEVNYVFRTTPSDAELDKSAYTSRVTNCREDITDYLASIGLGWEDFQNDWNGSVEKMYAMSSDLAENPMLSLYSYDMNTDNGDADEVKKHFKERLQPEADTGWTKLTDTIFIDVQIPDGTAAVQTYYAEAGTEAVAHIMFASKYSSPHINQPIDSEHTRGNTWRVVGYFPDGFLGHIWAVSIDSEGAEHYSEIINVIYETTRSAYSDDTVSQRVEYGLSIIMSSPLTSSNPQDYINEHRKEYENLTAKYPEGVLEYLLSQFEADNVSGLRGQIMMRMCKDMLGLQNNVTDESLSPQEWYKQLSIINEVKLPSFKPENPEGEYGELVYSAITQYYSQLDDGFLVAAPTVYGEYEEEGKLKIIMTVFYERYRLYGKSLESTGGGVIPGAAIFSRDVNGRWVFEEYLEIGSANLPDGAYFRDSIQKLCVMPVSGKIIPNLADSMNVDYFNGDRRDLLMQNLKEHLNAHRQAGVSLQMPDGSMVELTF